MRAIPQRRRVPALTRRRGPQRPGGSAAAGGAAAGVADALLAGLEDGEAVAVGRPRELGDGVGAHLVGDVARELVALLVDQRLARAEVHRAMPREDAAGGLLELPAAHR